MDWEKGFFWGGWGPSQKVVSLVAWDREVWLFFKVGRLGFFFSQGIIFLVMWVVGKKGWVCFYSFFFSQYGDLMKKKSLRNIL